MGMRMKLPKAGLIVIAVVVVVIGLVVAMTIKSKPVSQEKVAAIPSQPVASPTPAATATPTGYSAEFKAKVRSEFVNSCHTKAEYSLTVCNCVADYLANNYTESQIAVFYVQYHASNRVPEAIKTAVESCTGK
jgi:hypothetical protein